MKYLKNYAPKDGYVEIAKPGDGDLELTYFDMLRLSAGGKQSFDCDGVEIAIVVMSGTIDISGGDFSYENVGTRKDVFSGKASAFYAPSGNKFDVVAKSDCEIAISKSPSTKTGSVVLVTPDDVKEVTIGNDNWTRDAAIIIGDDVPADKLFIGEAYVPGGNWASFPPHKHDADNPPTEIDMEEIYFFRFNKPNGFGIQKIYTDDFSIDEAITVRENDAVLIPEGYHPVVTAPGYVMYYLWIMAGQNHRGFISIPDANHAWVAKA